ncbi:MAG TPA: hypothetical protein VKB34_16795 [Povalibacter sp.]|nr:hypothetical protein [Povalibacter sp.]
MSIRSLAPFVRSCALGALTAFAASSSPAFADGNASASVSHNHAQDAASGRSGELVKIVREATARFRDPAVAEAEGYKLQFGCVTGPDVGAMGLHYVNMSLVGDGELDPSHPEIVIYEPLSNGRVRLTGADFLVLAADWDAKHSGPPQLDGQLFHLFESPNRFGLPAFYTLHVWAWKNNPSGMFVNWHPNVSCEDFSD